MILHFESAMIHWFIISKNFHDTSLINFPCHIRLLTPVMFLRPNSELLHQSVRVSGGDHRGHHPGGGRDGPLHCGLLHHRPLPDRGRPHRPRVRPHLPPGHRQRLYLLWEEASLRHRHRCLRLWSGNFYFISVHKMVSFSFSLKHSFKSFSFCKVADATRLEGKFLGFVCINPCHHHLWLPHEASDQPSDLWGGGDYIITLIMDYIETFHQNNLISLHWKIDHEYYVQGIVTPEEKEKLTEGEKTAENGLPPPPVSTFQHFLFPQGNKY